MTKEFNTNYAEEFEDFMHSIVEVQIKDRQVPVYGKLIKSSAKFITLERRNGSPTTINKDAIELIQKTIKQDRKAVI